MKVSVIIPVYNAEKYLPQALDSVLSQTYGDYECICVNDGSTDGTAEILTRYEQKFNDAGRVLRIVTKANGGEGSARNEGLKAASGEWVTWLDADDMYAPTRLEEAMRIAELEHPDLIRTRRVVGLEPDPDFASIAAGAPYETFAGEHESQKWGWNTLASGGMVWMWFARREILNELWFRPELRVMTDGNYSVRLISRLQKACQSEYNGYFYREVPTSLIRGSRRTADSVKYLTACYDAWEECREPARVAGCYEEFLSQMRNAGEGVVADWAIFCDPKAISNEEIKSVYDAYQKLRRAGALSGKRTIYRFYGIPLWWWSFTSQIWMFKLFSAGIDFVKKLAGRD